LYLLCRLLYDVSDCVEARLSSKCSADEIASIVDEENMETWIQIAVGVEFVCDNADGIIEGFNITYHVLGIGLYYQLLEVIRNVTP